MVSTTEFHYRTNMASAILNASLEFCSAVVKTSGNCLAQYDNPAFHRPISRQFAVAKRV